MSLGRVGIRGLLSNVGWIAVGQGVRTLASLLVGVYVARYLGPSLFGDLSFARSVVSIINVFASFGLTQLLVVKFSESPCESGRILATGITIRWIGALLGAFACVGVGFAMSSVPNYLWVMSLAAITLAVAPLELLDAWFTSQTRSKLTVFGRIVSTIGGSALQVAAMAMGAGLLAFVLIDAAFAALFAITLLGFAYWVLPASRPFRFDKLIAMDLVKRSGPVWLAAGATIISVRVDQVVIRLMLGDQETGIYAVAARLSEFWYFVPIGIIATVIPVLTRQLNRDREEYLANVQHVCAALTGLGCLVALGVTPFANWAVLWLFGPDYERAGNVVLIYIWSTPFLTLGYLSFNLRLAQGQERSLIARAVFGAVSNVLLNILLIPQLGIYGAAIATLISYFLSSVFWDLFCDPSYGLGMIELRSFLPTYWVRGIRMLIQQLWPSR